MLLILFFGLPVLLATLVPRQWAAPLLATLAVVWGVLCIYFSRMHGETADVMGMFLLTALLQLMLLILGLRYLFAWRKQPLEVSGRSYYWARVYLWGVAGLVGAVFLAAFLVQVCNALFHAGWITHSAVALLAVAWWVLSPRAWRGASMHTAVPLHPASVVRWVGAVAITLALAWSVYSAQRVAHVAQVAAGGQAYCLLSATEQGLQPVNSVLDLAGFSMQAGRGAMRHAQLATGTVQAPVWSYWSYREAGFVSESRGGVLTCVPQADYAAKLPWWGKRQVSGVGAQSPDSVFWLAGGQWRIPAGYAGQAGDKPASLQFYAHGKDFGPPPGSLVRHGPQPWAQIAQNVTVTLCAPENIHPWYQPGDAKHQVRTVNNVHGLERQEIVTAANQVPRMQYVEKDAASGAPLSWMACDGPNASCHHAFVRDGMRVEFMQAAADLPHWKSLQDALWLRIQSFAVSRPDTALRRCAHQP
ncbi:hypothetical protein HZ993_04245 [Rhodoferax sp. AJA081-3]|uniref:hypothetical protein n=1 Tax=Rhodoferax sp. AJA081-3 TaxID=2752316 RepID=UPI001ADF4ED2|nr:hypothetical protein [Rhodoferax sp. AJA081-3]QTN29063.1 hypothetical protein HZ993_04245 [Rhodoferax sp. AJA081-3]